MLFPLGSSAQKTLCASFKSEVSVSPSPMELLHSSPTSLQSQMLSGLFFLMPDPKTGEPNLGLRSLTPVSKPLRYNFPVCGSPTWHV